MVVLTKTQPLKEKVAAMFLWLPWFPCVIRMTHVGQDDMPVAQVTPSSERARQLPQSPGRMMARWGELGWQAL